MVWFQFYQYIFIGTTLTQRLEKRGETRKAAEREANSRERKKKKKKKQRKKQDREEGKPGRGPAAFCMLRTSTTSHGGSGVQRGNKAGFPGGPSGWGRKGAAPRSCGWGEATARSLDHLAHPPPSSPQPPAPPLTSGPCQQGERQQAAPGGAHTPGHGGSGPSCAPRSQARGHAGTPARRRRVCNPLTVQCLPAGS